MTAGGTGVRHHRRAVRLGGQKIEPEGGKPFRLAWISGFYRRLIPNFTSFTSDFLAFGFRILRDGFRFFWHPDPVTLSHSSVLLYPRRIEQRLDAAIADTPAVLVAGPRQAGKTTLARQRATVGMRYLTLDDELTLLSAQGDPAGMIRSLDRAVIDEVQRAPQLLVAIKKSIDEDRRPGRFLLTGSTNLMTLPTVTDSLAGRMETLTLLPLSQAELHGGTANWLDAVVAGSIPAVSKAMVGPVLVDAVLKGGYPEMLARADARRQRVWARQYLDAIVQRDVREVGSIEKLDLLPRLLRHLAEAAGQPRNSSQLGAQVGLDGKTVVKYLGALEQLYLLRRVEVWSNNRLKRVSKMPKVQFIDSGLLATVVDLSRAEVERDRRRLGGVLEAFVFSELLKHSTTSDNEHQLLYYRDPDGFEVDVVVEDAAGYLVGVEVKASATVTAQDLRGLRKLSAIAGDRFKLGVILYDGTETLPLGHGIWAAPISTLWGV